MPGSQDNKPDSQDTKSPRVSPRRAAAMIDDAHSSGQPSRRLMGIWRLGESIHSGQMSQLFLAQPADAEGSPRWDYVLRTIPKVPETRYESAAQVNTFAEAAKAASHPNLVVVLDSVIDSAVPFLVMPRLEGQTLRRVLDGGRLHPLPVSLWFIRQAAEGLAALHASGWTHGDLKPENLLVSARGHVTVIDLGFAMPSKSVTLARPETFRGTPRYAAPERLGDRPWASPAADVFALGRVFWEMLSLVPPGTEAVCLEPVAELVAEMVTDAWQHRPSAAEVAARLLRLEIETLGQHIRPAGYTAARRAA